MEGILPDRFDRFRDLDAQKRVTALKGIAPDGGDPLLDRHAGKACASVKHTARNAPDAGRNGEGGQGSALREHTLLHHGNAVRDKAFKTRASKKGLCSDLFYGGGQGNALHGRAVFKGVRPDLGDGQRARLTILRSGDRNGAWHLYMLGTSFIAVEDQMILLILVGKVANCHLGQKDRRLLRCGLMVKARLLTGRGEAQKRRRTKKRKDP